MPSAPVLSSRDIFRRSNRSNSGIVASESGKYVSDYCIILETSIILNVFIFVKELQTRNYI